MIIEGSAVFTCPRTKQEVKLHKDCLDTDGRGTRCVFLMCWGGWTGPRPNIACSYKQQDEKLEPENHGEEVEEREQEGTGHEWRQPDVVQDYVEEPP